MPTSLLARVTSRLADHWPSPTANRDERCGGEPGSDAFAGRYALDQFQMRVRRGVGVPLPLLFGLDVLEVGCGEGGISCYLASIGARGVVGIDINAKALAVARSLQADLEAKAGRPLPVRFQEVNAEGLPFDDASFDVVLADNFFEHVDDVGRSLREMGRTLRDGGYVVAPNFSSIKSKYALHLKHGLPMPWLNLMLNEPTIVEALRDRIARHPELLAVYPGTPTATTRVRDVRAHRDLNDITHAKFLRLADEAGFDVTHFRVSATLLGKVVRRANLVPEASVVLDVLSTGAAAILRKRAS